MVLTEFSIWTFREMHLVGNAQVYDELVEKWKSFGLTSRVVCCRRNSCSASCSGSPESAPAKDDPSVVEGVVEFVAVPSYSAWFQNVLWILDHEADVLLELVAHGELEV